MGDITATISAARRLSGGRRLASHTVTKLKCDYTIKLPAGKTAKAASSTLTSKDTTSFATLVKEKAKAAGVGDLTVKVSGVTAAAQTTTKVPDSVSGVTAAHTMSMTFIFVAVVASKLFDM